jgi:hypothetical protein
MISKRTLEKWRKEALVMFNTSADSNDKVASVRIIKLTGELLDQQLINKGVNYEKKT